ncbi:glycoside hydrolase family 12 protein [Polyporus arcularius HHB13444]|uniref:Glycoside hydrolase family 12 protein n=1 Tax=Polyporus arcularius HHB13444 TaxID=1314778 RepID=A0A5C3PI46_9APHY|nr:glycoside hydrolase family 12 protein [Polyporus arcularius HHB13444]
MRCSSPLRPAYLLLALVQLRGALGQTLQGNDCTAAGAYTLCQNLWGANTGVGSQTTTLNSASGNSVSWETKYTWSNSPNNVKSYPNVYHNTAKGMQLQDIVSAPTSWQWRYQSASDDLAADVSYDIWFGVPKAGDPASPASSYEIMIWLSDRGGYVSDTTRKHRIYLQRPDAGWAGLEARSCRTSRSRGTPGTSSTAQTRTGTCSRSSPLRATSPTSTPTSTSSSVSEYLIDKQGVAKSQYIQAIQTGTEPFTGSADLVIDNFSVDVSTQEDAATTSSAAPSPTSTSSTSASTFATSSTSRHGESASISPSSSSSSSASYSQGRTATTTSSDVPAAQTSGGSTAETGSVRNGGGGQCRLTQPTTGSLRRRGKRSWVSRMFR